MTVRIENDWPVNSTRFLLPTVALRGFRAGPRTMTLAWWTWRIVVHLPNSAPTSKPTAAPTEGGAEMKDRGRKISRDARDLWIDIEKRISEIGKDFTSDMEVDHFTTQLGMYIGIQLGAEIGARLPTAAPTGGPNE